MIVHSPTHAQQAKGPILRILTDPTDFDTTFCRTTKCRNITFNNIGDTILRISSMDQLNSPFSGSIPIPFTLQKNESRTFSVCYRPTTAPSIDSQQVNFIGDNRVSLSIAMVFDVSGSMTTPDIYDPVAMVNVTRISAAHDAGIDFISGLLNTPDIMDEAAVYAFAATNDFMLRQNYTTNKILLTNAVPAAAPGAATCIYDALVRTATQLAFRPNRKVIILLTDGGDSGPGTCGPSTITTAADAARNAGASIFTVGIGAANPTALQQLALGTGGQYFTANNRTDLIAVYRTIATLLSQNLRQRFTVRGRAVSPFIVMNPTSIDFDSVRIGQKKCVPVVVTNTGDAPLTVSNIASVGAPFTFQTPPGINNLLPGAQTTLTVCFEPTLLREQLRQFTFTHNSCTQSDLQLNLRGVGYDSVTVALVDTFRAKPGSIIYVSVYLRTPLPAIYGVRSYSLSVSYNKTIMIPVDPVLYPGHQAVQRTNTLSVLLPSASFSETPGTATATTVYNLSGGILSNPKPADILVKLGFLVLHGNDLTTPINLIAATFEDGNPRVGRVQPGLLIADSLCFQRDRLIDARVRIASILKQNIPNPFNPMTTIRYSISDDVWTKLIIYDAMGREVVRLVDGWRNAGEYEAVFDAAQYTSGMYFYRIESGAFRDMKKMLLAK